MTTAIVARRQHVLDVMKRDDRFQFGQRWTTRQHVPEDVGCGPNAIQLVAHVWGKPAVTMDDVLAVSGAADIAKAGGLYTHEVTTALNALGLRYEGVYDADPRDLMRVMKQRGPIVFLCEYLYWPQWEGYHLPGDTATGIPNGYARPAGRAGKNDLPFEGGHYGVGLSSLYRRSLHRSDVWLRDPDHNSALRPETPRWDVVNDGQWTRLARSGANLQSGHSYAAIPKHSL